jgi:acyl-coenzyme A thioesterase PaaI-like protein
VRAVAKLVRRGRAVALADVELSQQGQLVAKGLFTYLQPELDERSGV